MIMAPVGLINLSNNFALTFFISWACPAAGQGCFYPLAAFIRWLKKVQNLIPSLLALRLI
jgi:hypothetical protein